MRNEPFFLKTGVARKALCVIAVLFFHLSFFVPAQAQVKTRGIDVSKFQGNINWTKVAKDKTVKFVYIKATEGTSIQDPYYKTNVAKARKAGLLVGSYHLYSSKTTAYQQFASTSRDTMWAASIWPASTSCWNSWKRSTVSSP